MPSLPKRIHFIEKEVRPATVQGGFKMCIRDRAYVEQHKAAYEKLDDLIGPHTVRTKAYEAMKPLMLSLIHI